MGTVNNKLSYLHETKHELYNAIVEKGVIVDPSLPFRQYADQIRAIPASNVSNLNLEKFVPLEDFKKCKVILQNDSMEGYTRKALFLYYDDIERDISFGGANELIVKTCDGSLYTNSNPEVQVHTHTWDISKCETSTISNQKMCWYIQYSKADNSFVHDYLSSYICIDSCVISDSVLKPGEANYYGIDGINGSKFKIDSTSTVFNLLFHWHLNFFLDIDLSDVTTCSLFQSTKSFVKYPKLLNTQNITDYTQIFMMSDVQVAPYFDTKGGVNLRNFFASCYRLKSVPLYNFERAEIIEGLFYWCMNLETIPQFNFPKATDATQMFSACYNLKTMPISDFPALKTAYSMFSNCLSLIDISTLNMPNLENAKSMFSYCSLLPSVKFKNLNKVTLTTEMFEHCEKIKYVGLIDMSLVTDAKNMFSCCYNLEDVDILNINCDLSFRESSKLSHECLIKLINNLITTTTVKTLTLGSINVNKLTAQEKILASTKGWVLA